MRIESDMLKVELVKKALTARHDREVGHFQVRGRFPIQHAKRIDDQESPD